MYKNNTCIGSSVFSIVNDKKASIQNIFIEEASAARGSLGISKFCFPV